MENEALPFEVEVDGRTYLLSLGNCAIVLFRQQQEVDYLAIDRDEEETLLAFNNPEMCRYMAGIAIEHTDEGLVYQNTLFDGASFRDRYGWNAPVIIKERPKDNEIEQFMEVATGSLEKEWEGLGDD